MTDLQTAFVAQRTTRTLPLHRPLLDTLFIVVPFYGLLFVVAWNRIQLFAAICATIGISFTALIFGFRFFGAPGEHTTDAAAFLLWNIWWLLFPLLLIIRMRKPLPFTRAF